MNRKQQSAVLAGLLTLALAGCSSTRSPSDDMAGGSRMGSATGTSSPSSTTAATSAADGSMASPAQAQAGSTMMPAGPPNAVVIAIDTIPARSAAAADSAVGGSGTSGTTGSSTGTDKMYRITLRMDDGSTRVVTQDKAPTFSSGDRVNMMDGMISR